FLFLPLPTSSLLPLSLHDALPILDLELAQHAAGQPVLGKHAPDRLLHRHDGALREQPGVPDLPQAARIPGVTVVDLLVLLAPGEDRKSTRLNSSHVSTSYAACCLK